MRKTLRTTLCLLALAPAASCGSDDPVSPFTGALSVSVAGLPAGTSTSFMVTGPAGFEQHVDAGSVLRDLIPGQYLVSAVEVAANEHWYLPAPQTQTVPVSIGVRTKRSVSYSRAQEESLNLWIAAMHVTQGSQTLEGSVPLVHGRDGLLRVFVRANENNTATPMVRVKVFDQGTLRQTSMIAAPTSSVPTTSHQQPLTTSWNVAIPGSLIRPGLRILAEVDPNDEIPERNERDNRFPATGAALPMDVRWAPPFRVMFVPVRSSSSGLSGDVTSANQSDYTSFAMRLFPVPAIDAQVRTPYTTSADALQADNANRAWHVVLSEINALRAVTKDGRHWYGVVRAPYAGGHAGVGYVGGAAAVGVDRAASRGWVAAHEWGHNFGRRHAPCGRASGTDASYPHGGGRIGAFGIDVAAQALKDTSMTDIMGYCGNRWVSDYTFRGILAFRGSAVLIATSRPSDEASLLVWGRVSNGVVELEPAFELTTAAEPPTGGPFRLDVMDAAGGALGTYAFDAAEVADGATDERHFAFTIPLPRSQRARLHTLRIRAPGAAMVSASASPTLPDPPASVVADGDVLTITWDASRHPMVMVRDAHSGEILSFARTGRVAIRTSAREVDLALSNRVLSRSERVRAVERR